MYCYGSLQQIFPELLQIYEIGMWEHDLFYSVSTPLPVDAPQYKHKGSSPYQQHSMVNIASFTSNLHRCRILL
jgi:hypothetical protein